MIKTCEYCTKEYKVKPSRAERSHYCSKDCHNKGQKGKHRTPMHTCPQCGTEFRATNKIQICCSRECTARLRDFEIYKEKECSYCGILFYSDKKNQKCCSRTCTMYLRMSDPIEREKVFSSRRGESSWNKDMKMDDEWCEANKQRMLAYYQTDKGKQQKILAAEKYGSCGPYKRGYYLSEKTQEKLHYDSSYEERAYKILDKLDTVKTYRRTTGHIEYFLYGRSHYYFQDIHISYTDGREEVVEVKPINLLKLPKNVAKFKAANKFYKDSTTRYVIWTEAKLNQLEEQCNG